MKKEQEKTQPEEITKNEGEMSIEQAFSIIKDALERGQRAGAYSLEEAASILNIYNSLSRTVIEGVQKK